MATVKRQRHNNTAGKPTISVTAERSAQSLTAERKALTLRRAGLIGAVALPIAIAAGLLLYFRLFAPAAASRPAPAAPVVLPTAAAAVQAPAAPTAAPAVAPTAAPASRAAPTAAPAAIAAPQSGAPTSGALVCEAIAGLPLYAGATCIKHDLDHDDGVIKAENTYATAAAADDVRRFFEGAFAANGWTLAESDYDAEDVAWTYTITQGPRRLKVEVESKRGPNGAFTRIKIAEK